MGYTNRGTERYLVLPRIDLSLTEILTKAMEMGLCKDADINPQGCVCSSEFWKTGVWLCLIFPKRDNKYLKSLVLLASR